MNALNAVKIETTFRTQASSALEAAKLAAPKHLAGVSVTPLVDCGFPENYAFLICGVIGNSVYHHVAFVDSFSLTIHRVEVGSVSLSDIEMVWLIGGDELIEAVGFYADGKDPMTQCQYDKWVSHWINHDIESGEKGRMENYFINKCKKVISIADFAA